MGLVDHKLGISEGGALDLSQHKIEIVLGEPEILELDQGDPTTGGLAVTVNAVDLEAPIPQAIIQSAAILCVQVSLQSPRSAARIALLREEYPALPVIALVRDADVALVRSLLRQGVHDVVELPLSIHQLAESVREILRRMAPRPVAPPRRTGKLISVVKSIGGVGATNVGVNLATALGADCGGDAVCLFDLDVQFGNAATYLGASGSPSLSDLLEGGARIDSDFLKTVKSTVASGISFVPAPPEIQPIEIIDTGQLHRILAIARGEFDHVVVDLPANWANWTLSVVAESDLVILVVTLSIASLRQGKRQLHLLRAQGVDLSKILVLVNRVEQRLFKSIGLDDAAKVLGHPVTLFVHNDYPLMSAANNQGVVVSELNKRSKIAKDYVRIAQSIAEITERAVQ